MFWTKFFGRTYSNIRAETISHFIYQENIYRQQQTSETRDDCVQQELEWHCYFLPK